MSAGPGFIPQKFLAMGALKHSAAISLAATHGGEVFVVGPHASSIGFQGLSAVGKQEACGGVLSLASKFSRSVNWNPMQPPAGQVTSSPA